MLTRTRGVWDLQRSPPLMNLGLLIHFFDFLIAEAKITWSHKCVFPLHLPRKGPDLDSFSDFLEKPETSFCTIFWYYVQHFELIFFQFFPGGVTNNFPLETPQNRPKNTNFLNIHQIKNWEYETLSKNKWLRRWWQNFWVSTNFATFLIKKKYDFKYRHMGA